MIRDYARPLCTYGFVRWSSPWSYRRSPVEGRAPQQSLRIPNCFTCIIPSIDMDDMDPDTTMVAAGVVISLIAILELYPAWKKARAE